MTENVQKLYLRLPGALFFKYLSILIVVDFILMCALTSPHIDKFVKFSKYASIVLIKKPYTYNEADVTTIPR